MSSDDSDCFYLRYVELHFLLLSHEMPLTGLFVDFIMKNSGCMFFVQFHEGIPQKLKTKGNLELSEVGNHLIPLCSAAFFFDDYVLLLLSLFQVIHLVLSYMFLVK